MRLFLDTLHRNRASILLWCIISVVNLAVVWLYDLLTEPFLYASLLGLFFLCVLLTVSFLREKQRAKQRRVLIDSMDWKVLPPACNLAEEDYEAFICRMGAVLDCTISNTTHARQEALDYYTAWVHEIKTPIAVMKLKLSEDTPEHRALSEELFRVEQYVDMALSYIRLDSATNDLVIQEYRLDDLITEAVRKYAPQFISKKLRLDYVPTDETVITDRKWFVCILEQLISNAIKYTDMGSVSIRVENERLTVADTGIGIAPEDIPRIFEKGFTGQNGRIGQKSSGLGLYLAKKAADLLAVNISVQSKVGRGSAFTVDYHRDTF